MLVAIGLAVATLLVFAATASRGRPASGAGERLSPGQVEQVEAIIRDYLLGHPELLVEAVRELERRQQEAAAQRVRDAIAARRDELDHDPGAPVGGNPAGDVTVVEFFDYQCPYCRAAAPELDRLLAEDGGVRVVYKEWPILGLASDYAARAALAAREQGAYGRFHRALMAERGRLSEERVLAVAGELGLDTERLQRDLRAPGIGAALRRTRELAAALGIDGTPTFVIGDAVIPGAIALERMRSLVEDARRRARGTGAAGRSGADRGRINPPPGSPPPSVTTP